MYDNHTPEWNRDKVWNKIERRLQSRKKRRRLLPFWWLGSGVFALLIGIYMVYPVEESTPLSSLTESSTGPQMEVQDVKKQGLTSVQTSTKAPFKQAAPSGKDQPLIENRPLSSQDINGSSPRMVVTTDVAPESTLPSSAPSSLPTSTPLESRPAKVSGQVAYAEMRTNNPTATPSLELVTEERPSPQSLPEETTKQSSKDRLSTVSPALPSIEERRKFQKNSRRSRRFKKKWNYQVPTPGQGGFGMSVPASISHIQASMASPRPNFTPRGHMVTLEVGMGWGLVKYGGSEAFQEARKATEDFRNVFRTVAKSEYYLSPKWFISEGIAIEVYNERYEYAFSDTETVNWANADSAFVYTLPDGSRYYEGGVRTRTTQTDSRRVNYNRMLRLSCPVSIGYILQDGRWSIRPEIGFQLNFDQYFFGVIRDENGGHLTNNTTITDRYYENIFDIGLLCRLNFRYALSEEFEMQVSMGYNRDQLLRLSRNYEGPRYETVGLSLGLARRIGR
ncbi:MAG: hypothetical protein AAFV95_22300 [Bacteroidota bacterium]